MSSNAAAKVDGRKARQLEWTARINGQRTWALEAAVINGKHIYYIQFLSQTKLTAEDRTRFVSMLSSVDMDPAR